jgi:hypothetical protein
MAASPCWIEEGLTVKLTTTGDWLAAPPPMDSVMQPDADIISNKDTRITFLIDTSSSN